MCHQTDHPLLKTFYFFNWWKIALQICVSFWHTITESSFELTCLQLLNTICSFLAITPLSWNFPPCLTLNILYVVHHPEVLFIHLFIQILTKCLLCARHYTQWKVKNSSLPSRNERESRHQSNDFTTKCKIITVESCFKGGLIKSRRMSHASQERSENANLVKGLAG